MLVTYQGGLKFVLPYVTLENGRFTEVPKECATEHGVLTITPIFNLIPVRGRLRLVMKGYSYTCDGRPVDLRGREVSETVSVKYSWLTILRWKLGGRRRGYSDSFVGEFQ